MRAMQTMTAERMHYRANYEKNMRRREHGAQQNWRRDSRRDSAHTPAARVRSSQIQFAAMPDDQKLKFIEFLHEMGTKLSWYHKK